MRWLNKIFSNVFYLFAIIISYLPNSILYSLSDFVAFFLRRILGYRKAVIIQNLSRAFPELNYKEIENLKKSFYRNFSDVFIESIMSNSMSVNKVMERYKIKNPQLINEYINQGRDVIALGGHVSNWEWISFIAPSYKFQCYTLYKPLSSKTTEIIINRFRQRFGMNLLPMNKAARFILTNRKEKSLYIFIGDQSPAKHEDDKKFIFLNQETTFFNGGARLACTMKTAVVYLSVTRVKRGIYELEFIPINNTDYSEIGIISEYSKLLEENIRSHPANWLWSHKRWKHKFQ